MEEDDEFGDLYAGLGTSSGAELPTTSAPSIAPQGMARFLGEDDDDDDDDGLYSGFGIRRQGPPPAAAPDSIARAQEFAEDLPENAPPGAAGDGSESDSDDDLTIVLNSDNKRKAAEVAEQEAIPGEGNEEDEAPGTAPTPSWPEDSQQQQQQQQQGGSLGESQPLLPPPSPLLGLPPGVLPPGILPPGLVPQDQAPRPGFPVVAAPPRPAGRPPAFMHHAQFKYVRGPMAGGPMMNSNPGVLGRGSYPPGWGPGKGPLPPGAGRPYAEFHLPPTKSVFDMDLDAFEAKPWRNPNVDISDYFNFGFNEASWRMYCQQLGQLRLESTMQTKISVYESRSDQPIGRAIQVEGGIGERRPSFDARRNRNRDSNEVIEIVLREAEVENHFMGNDYDGTVWDLDEASRMGRNSPYTEADGHFFPMGPRPRGPYRMFPGGPYPGRGPRPPFFDPGLPMHMRPEGYGGEYGDPSRSRARNSSQARGADEELSSGSLAVKDDRKNDERRRGSRDRDRDREDDEKSDEHKRSHSEDDRKHMRHSDSSPRPEKDVKKEPADAAAAAAAERSSRSDEENEDHRARHHHHHRSRGVEDEPEASERHSRRTPSEKDRVKEEDWSSRKSYREREDPRRKEEDSRRSRGDEESSRRRDEESSRRRDEESSRRKDESWKRDRDRDESQKRRSGYDEYEYDRRDRDDDRDRSGRRYEKISLEDDEYHRRKSKHETSGRKESSSSYRYEEEYYRKSSSSRREPEKDEKQHHHHSSRGKELPEKRNGSASEYNVDERKRRKSGAAGDEIQKSGHAEKPAVDFQVDVVPEKKSSSRKVSVKTEPAYDESYSSDGDDDEDNRRRKGRSKMERLNRERPPQTKEAVDESLARMSSRQEPEKRSSGSGPTSGPASAPESKSGKANGDRQEFLESVARRKERFMKMETTFERKPSIDRDKVSTSQSQAQDEFKHERPARKRRWGS